MRGNFAGGVVVRVARVMGFAAAAPLLVSSLAYAQSSRQSDQSSDRMLAIRRCDSELNFIMARDNGGQNPDANIDSRRRQARQTSDTQWELSGRGSFVRDSNDRGRPFSYTCRVDVDSGQVAARYQWAGNSSGNTAYDRQDAEYPPLPQDSGQGAGRESRPGGPPGRVWTSGGIISRNSGKGLDVVGRSTQDAAHVQQWEFGGGSNQMWDFVDIGGGQFAIVSQGSNKVIEVANSRGEDGTNIIQNHWNGGDDQRWRIERKDNGFFEIVNVHSGKCLDVEGKKTENGANIQQWTCGGGANQLWRIQRSAVTR
jgi:hypothetical protein